MTQDCAGYKKSAEVFTYKADILLSSALRILHNLILQMLNLQQNQDLLIKQRNGDLNSASDINIRP